MKLSFSTNAFTNYPLDEAVRRIAEAGYPGVEVLADQPHLFCPEATPEVVQTLMETLTATGLTVANLNANTATGYYGRSFWEPLFEPSLANPDPGARAWRRTYTKAALALARVLGAGSISITAGRMLPGLEPRDSMLLLKDSLAELLIYAEQAGVRIGIEYEPGLLIENCAELVAFLEEVDSPWLGANLDIGHSRVAGEDIPTVIDTLGDKIFHVHLEDIRDAKHYHRIPGEGDLDFAAILASLKRQSYDGYLTVELYTYPQRPAEAAEKAYGALSRLLPLVDL